MQTSRSSNLYLKEGNYIIDKQTPSLCLGKGSFGQVYKGYDTTNQRQVAIKQINIELLSQFDQQMKQVILNEINVMRKFSKKMKEIPCQYLVKLYDCFRSDKYVYIVMEFCHHGTLFDQLRGKKDGFSQTEVIQIAKELVEGLVYLQNMSIAHRDLKPQNIFVSQSENEQDSKKIYKIGDFGFAAKKSTFNDVMGTYPYMAPQIFRRQQYSTKVDVWSLGITIHQLLFKKLYYLGKDKWQIQQLIKQKDYQLSQQQKSKISQKMQNFLKLCLTKNKFQRPLASWLIKHEIFSQQKQQQHTVFTLLKSVIQRCQKLLQMSISFDHFENTSKKNTIFIQLYLLKFAYCEMNRVAYSIQSKENYINLPSEKFQQLINPNNEGKYQQLNQLSQKVRNQIASLFTTKYQTFQQQFLPKFKPHDQQLIQKAINAEPYEEPIYEVFVTELKKWAVVIKNDKFARQFTQLKQQCEKIIVAFQQNN